MRHFAAVLATVTLVSTGLVVGAAGRTAWACSCAVLTEAEYADMADVVFAGTLTRIDTPEGEKWSSTDPETYVFAVDSVFKGEAAEVQNVVTARDGASCGFEGMSPGGEFVVYARTDPRGGPEGQPGDLYSGLCTGTGPWDGSAVPAEFTGPGSPPATATAPPTAPPTSLPGDPAAAPPTISAADVPPTDDGWSTNDWLLAAVVAVPLVALLGLGMAQLAQRRRR
jgi:hypothetical protein